MNTRMKVIIGIAFVALIGIAAFSISKMQDKTDETDAVRAEAHALFTDYTDGVSKAKAGNKLILVDVFTDWCVWCKRMDKDIYTDPAVQAEMSKYFTSVKLDAEATKEQTFRGASATEQSIAQNMKVTGYPTTVFMTPDEQVIQAIPGYIKAPEFALILRYIGTKGYETKKFEEWKKTQS